MQLDEVKMGESKCLFRNIEKVLLKKACGEEFFKIIDPEWKYDNENDILCQNIL